MFHYHQYHQHKSKAFRLFKRTFINLRNQNHTTRRITCSYNITEKCILSEPFQIKKYAFSSSANGITEDIKKLPPEFINEISSIKDVTINTNKYKLDCHGHGESYHAVKAPSCILYPSTVESISSIVKICTKYKVPIIAFGQGTSVEGHVNAIHGGVSLDMGLLDNIEMDEDSVLEDFMVTVGAGITRKKLNEALKHTGQQFIVDPGADASICGMVACGANGGTAAVKYGTMKDNIVGL